MTVQGALRTITRNLPFFVAGPIEALLGKECFDSLIVDVTPTGTCVRLAVSKGLGVGIIVFGSILKLPQIATIVRHESAWGISLSMYALEVVAYTISLAYAFRKRMPFSTYGENASLTVQNMIITLLIIWYSPSSAAAAAANAAAGHSQHTVAHQRTRSSLRLRHQGGDGIDKRRRVTQVAWTSVAMVAASVFLFFLCPSGLLSVFQAFSIPISLLSKFPQIIELHRNQQCGHLSAIVVFAQLAGTLARVFTTVTETGDWLLGIGFGLASVLNAVIAVQYVYYWKHGVKSLPRSSLPLTNATFPRNVSGKIWTASDDEERKHKETSTVHTHLASVIAVRDHDEDESGKHAYGIPSSSLASSGRHVFEKGRREE